MGDHIRELRLRAGLTLGALADKLGISRAAVSYWEIGKQFPTADKLPDLADALGCSIDELFGRSRAEGKGAH